MLERRAISALLWVAAFCFATGLFLSATLLLRPLPPTAPVAVGRVTIEKASKARDYASAALFFVIVPAATLALSRAGERVNEALRRRTKRKNTISLLFVAPFFLAPFLYLTTFKWGWPLLIPLILSQLLPRAVIAYERKQWLRRLAKLRGYHALVIAEGLAWILFRYIATATRIAHIPTLFLEIVFVFFFLALFWSAFVLIARLASFTVGVNFERAFQRVAIAAMPLVALPVAAIVFVPREIAITIAMVLVVLTILFTLRGESAPDDSTARAAVAFLIAPVLLYCASYASTASLTQWIDLFHRGESLGPASDYLRGKVPYRDIFVLHGMLHNGLLDAWLMELFGRREEIALARPVILGSFVVPALWFLGLAIFRSMPLALLCVLLGAVTTVDNERAFFEIAVLVLLITGKRWLVALSGVFAAVTLFFSFDIGLYAIGGSLLVLLLMRAWRSLAAWLLGFAIGAAPFVGYLLAKDAFGAFLETSFVTVPRIIDAVWSLPFPDLTRTFRKDLNLHTLSDFFLFDHFRFVLNPLVIGIALIVLAQRWLTKKNERIDLALLALTIFAMITQRSALGRADFPHQYFSAFLIGPMILALLVLLARAAARVWRTSDRSAQAFVLLAAVALFPFLFTALWVPDIANARLDDTLRYLPRVTKIGFRDPLAEEIRNRIDSVRYHVMQLSKPGEPVFDFSNQPAFYFFLDRPNPTRFYQVPILSPKELQREAIVALERAKPPLIIRRSPQQFDVFDGVDNAIRAQAVAAYIDDRYAYARSVRGVEIWKRTPSAQRLDVDAYLRRIRIPTLKELDAAGARTRLVFPTVGSVPGANNSFWRSDLVLHNQFEQAMTIGLRYVAGDVRIDRSVTLGPRRTLRWEDVVKTLFRAPDSRGVLWIEYRGERGPVARVKTYDAARAARASLDSPLTMRDAARSHTEFDDLTIVGLPAGRQQDRRINIGVVNVGEIPATFRITVRTRDGRRVGRIIEEGLPEDESQLLIDVEQPLRVALDEGSTVHVTMIAGTCVAYATVVGGEGDNQFIAAVPSPKP